VRDPVPDPRRVYEQARVVLVPYRHPGRPRVVAEAHASGIPVIGSDGDGTAEAVGPAGIVVPLDDPLESWVAALAALWDDADRYAAAVTVAREWAARPEMDPEVVVAAFEDCTRIAIERARG
jgi:glycosyltransferase involved in cell wall biosynthesis